MPLLDSPDSLHELCRSARQDGILAIDMEFERERTFRPILQLIQVATRSHEPTLVDPLALDDLGELWDLICDDETVIVVHAGSQDMEIVFHESGGGLPSRVFDTQIAAALLGMGEQPGYGDLVRRLTGVRLKKGERTTDWGKRPLTEAQIRYALDDVVHLLPMHDQLEEELEKRGRRPWLEAELAFFHEKETYERDRRTLWQRVSRHRSLGARELAILRELAAWREDTAYERNVPRNRVVNDEVLVELSRRQPSKTAELRQLRRLHPREIERSGDEILEIIALGQSCPKEDWPRVPRRRSEDADLRVTTDLLATFVKYRGGEAEIAPSYLASKSQIKAFASAHRRGEVRSEELDLARGWRYELVGRDLERFLDGELGLSVDPSNGRLRLLPLAGTGD